MTTRFIFVMVCFSVTGCSNWRFFKHSSTLYQHYSLDCAIPVVHRSNIQKPFTTKTWYIGRVYRMSNFFGNNYVEYREPTDIVAHSMHMERGLCWYQKSNGLQWTYNLIDQMMVSLDIDIALASMMFVLRLEYCKLLP